jgi:hypothetical protein
MKMKCYWMKFDIVMRAEECVMYRDRTCENVVVLFGNF